MVDPVTISLAVGVLVKLFKWFTGWLKSRNKLRWKEDHRMLKIVRDWHNKEWKGGAIPHYIQVLMDTLEERKRLEWASAPNARALERDAIAEVTEEEEEDPGYLTDMPEDSDEDLDTDDDDGDDFAD